MEEKKILVVMGTRPEVIKLAPVIQELRRHSRLKTLVCSTGQHRQILDQTMSFFNMKPDFELGLMTHDQSLPVFLQNSLAALNKVVEKVKPDMTVVQGDTLTAAAAALASYYAKVPVAHVEAGLRSHDMNNPFPEEANRLLIDNISDLMFVPTSASARNLKKEGFTRSRVVITGNTVIDSLRRSLKTIDRKIECCRIPSGKKLMLVTLHRRESFGKTMKGILQALRDTVEDNKKLFMIYPVHPNPNVRGPAYEILQHPRIKLIDPLPYLPFLSLMSKSDFVVTDSGGVQEEAPALDKPVIVLRKSTERSEAVHAGYARLLGTDPDDIRRQLSIYTKVCTCLPPGKNIFGDGKASERIAASILNYFFPEKYRSPEEFTGDIVLKDLNPKK